MSPPDQSRNLPSLPLGWAWTTLDDLRANTPNALTDGPFGSNLKSSDYVPSGVRVIRLGNIGVGEFRDDDQSYITEEKFDMLRKHEARPGDLIIAALAEPVGRACEVPMELGSALVKADCIRFRPHPAVHGRFILHALNSPQGQKRAEAASHGIGRLRINLENLRSLPISLAPAPEQFRIVSKLESLQARSRRAKEALDAIPALLERFRQSVLAAAFRGDLTADWRAQHPDVEPASQLLERIRAERRRRWEEAELERMRAGGKPPYDDKWKSKYKEPAEAVPPHFELPKNWAWATWGLLSDWVTYGFTRPMPHVAEGPTIITAKNISNGKVAFDDTHKTTEEAFAALSEKDRPLPGDILITKDGTIGRAAIVPVGSTFCINQSVAVVWLRSHLLNRQYLLRVIEAPFTQRAITEQARGNAIQHLSITDFAQMAVPIPPLEEQSALAQLLDAKLSKITVTRTAQECAARRIKHLDDALLAKAFRGELVPQDPNDEPASVLLERIRAEREASDGSTPKRSRGRRPAA
ncbi:MAG TPA: restriction endonuclease subunit S [Archangium sp.]|nr:restriction endonuclease subunit S [Archangium sp.]